MANAKLIFGAIVLLVVAFAGGFVLRPVISPALAPSAAVPNSGVAAVSNEARGTQYFVSHIDEAREIVAGCGAGSVRGGECATAEEAIIKVEAQERRKRFLGK